MKKLKQLKVPVFTSANIFPKTQWSIKKSSAMKLLKIKNKKRLRIQITDLT